MQEGKRVIHLRLLSLDLHCHMVLNKRLAAYHWLPEELVLGVVLAEHKPRVTLQRPGRLNLQHNLVVLQTPLCGDRMRYEKFRHTAVKRFVHRVVLPRPRVGWTSRRAQFSWSLQWAVCTNMWHASLAVAPGETHTDLLWLSSPYTLIAWKQTHTHTQNYQKHHVLSNTSHIMKSLMLILIFVKTKLETKSNFIW